MYLYVFFFNQVDEGRVINEELEKLKKENTILVVCMTWHGH